MNLSVYYAPLSFCIVSVLYSYLQCCGFNLINIVYAPDSCITITHYSKRTGTFVCFISSIDLDLTISGAVMKKMSVRLNKQQDLRVIGQNWTVVYVCCL